MEQKIITTKEELVKVIASYDWHYFDSPSKSIVVGDDDKYGLADDAIYVAGEALEYLLEGEAEDEKRLVEINRLEAEAEEADIIEEEEAEQPIDCYSESLLLPRGGVFKGDFGSATKAQVKAANREWRRRKSTGRFYDDGSRWN